MIAIVDSGSTKADWVFTDGKKVISLSSGGMNPNTFPVAEIENTIKTLKIKFREEEVKKIFFLGTGCSGSRQRKIITSALRKKFSRAAITVDHDIMGAAIATCGNDPGIACIIGTGSNSVYYDGKKIFHNNYGMGYVLADEAAGTWLGKKLVTGFLYGTLPPVMMRDFQKKYKLTKEIVVIKVYKSPSPNKWLASFSGFLADHKNNPWVKDTIRKGFEEFIDLFVLNYSQSKKVPIHFVGSIAFHYKLILEKVIRDKKLIQGKIIQKPIEELTKYYIKKEKL